MIPARKSPLFNAFFAGHARSRIHASFGAVVVHGLERTRALGRERPLLLVANHVSWWDPLVILHASQHLLEVDGHAMMNAANLRRLPFFGLVGAFGVDLASASDGAAALRYAAKLLDRPGRAAWIFAQGEERPANVRPLGFRPGAAAIRRVARRAAAVPVAIRYEHLASERPTLFLSFGEALGPDAELEAAVVAELDRIERAIAGDSADFATIFRNEPGALARFLERALAWLTAPRMLKK